MTHVHDLPLTIPSGDEVDCETCKSLLWLIRQHIAETPPTYQPTYQPAEDRSGMGLNLKPRPATQAVHEAFNLHAHYDEVTGEALKGEPAGLFDAHLRAEEAADLRDTAELPAVEADLRDIDPQGPDNRRYGYPWAQTGSEAGCYS